MVRGWMAREVYGEMGWDEVGCAWSEMGWVWWAGLGRVDEVGWMGLGGMPER